MKTVYVLGTDIDMEFGIKKYGVLTMKRGKIVKSEGMKLPDGEKMKQVRQEGCKYLGIIKLDKIKEIEMKEKITKEYNMCDNLIEARRPELIAIDKKEQKEIIIDIVVPADVRVEEKGKEKVEKYQDLKKEIRRLWKLGNVEIVSVVIGALGSVSGEIEMWMGKLGIPCEVGGMQKSVLLVIARILRKVLEM